MAHLPLSLSLGLSAAVRQVLGQSLNQALTWSLSLALVSSVSRRFVHQSLGQSLGKSSLLVSLSVCCRTLIALSYAQQGAADGMEEVVVRFGSCTISLRAGFINRMLSANLNMRFEAICQPVYASSEHLPQKEGFVPQNKFPSRLGRFFTFNYNTL